MSDYMAAQMDSQIDGAISENERLCNEVADLRLMLAWAYSKLHNRAFSSQEDCMELDRLRLYVEHGLSA